ncbi:MAG: hypothetical protein ACR5KW_02745 [Wolbachia sp.]
MMNMKLEKHIEISRKYHSDKYSGANKNVQKQNEERFKELDDTYKYFTREDIKGDYKFN